MRATGIFKGMLLTGLLALAPAAAEACAVCFGAADSKMAEGMNAGILALLVVVVVVQIGFVAMFLNIRHRSKKLEERRESLRVIRGGTG